MVSSNRETVPNSVLLSGDRNPKFSSSRKCVESDRKRSSLDQIEKSNRTVGQIEGLCGVQVGAKSGCNQGATRLPKDYFGR
jgi:hypothetical protein